MKVLIVSATKLEIEPALKRYEVENAPEKVLFSIDENIFFLVTGVGIAATSYWLGKILSQHHFDVVINAGIAGSFKKDISLGEVVLVAKDIIADIGAQDKDTFIPIDELGFAGRNEIETTVDVGKWKDMDYLKVVNAITVNTVHGNKESIKKVVKRLNPDIESMEGAAFYLACKNSEVEGVQVRAISNYVEERNREAWNIPLAIRNLNIELINFVDALV